MGKLGCDNRLAHELEKAGYTVVNPSLTVQCWHLHNKNERGYNILDRPPATVVQPPYKNVQIK